jgi:hypothetical protein
VKIGNLKSARKSALLEAPTFIAADGVAIKVLSIFAQNLSIISFQNSERIFKNFRKK